MPQTISVIDREELDDHNVRDIQDLVRHEPGISVSRQTSITESMGPALRFLHPRHVRQPRASDGRWIACAGIDYRWQPRLLRS
ncbi:TonB-dependent receptor plug domain-containing protein [Aliirhizobium terrae]|uniref:TonB-dependent receptor plug domain-containing protein n=1 Tax=Terrirhizobium terrae TaxID=2926709 RepID=UPI00336AC78B